MIKRITTIFTLIIIVFFTTIIYATSIQVNNNEKLLIKKNEYKINNVLKINDKIKVGDIIKRGKINYTVINNNNYDDIEWIVLDIKGSNILLFSKYIINYMPFSEANNAEWKDSEIRNYLNNDFLNGIVVFLSPQEKTHFNNTTLETNIITKSVSSSSEISTNDKIFLLSKEEMDKYFECINGCYQCDFGLIIDFVKNAKFENQYKLYKEENKYNFLLRDKNTNNNTLLIDKNGKLIENGISSNIPCGIRPAMWINDIDLIDNNIIKFGQYEQDNNIKNGKESIEWIPITANEEKVLLISKFILDFKTYSFKKENIDWEKSDIRKFLNNDFYNNSFTNNEQYHIASSDLVSFTGSYRDKEGPISTKDYIFIPGYYEYELLNSYKGATKKIFKTTRTLYASNIIKNTKYDSMYWLRDFYSKYHSAVYVKETGEIEWDLDKLESDLLGIRPMLWLDITKGDISNIINKYKEETNIGPINDIINQKTIDVDWNNKEFIFGKYEQDNIIDNGKENLEWTVLGNFKNNKNVFICATKYIIDAYKFDDDIGVLYENSDIREYLINDIYNELFNDYEKSLLYEIDINNNISDKISLLNFDICMQFCDVEYNPRFGNLEYLDPVSATTYAKSKYFKFTNKKMYENKSGNSEYYLRDIDDASYGVLFVNSNGYFRNIERNYIYKGIRPIIIIELKKDE